MGASGSTNSVAAVTASPAVNKTIPRRTGQRPRFQQKPESKIKLQQIICCHKKPGVPSNQLSFIPRRFTRSHTA